MSSESQEPFYSREQMLSDSEPAVRTSGILTSQQRKIDPVGLLGKIFAGVGAVLVVIGVLLAYLLGFTVPGGFGFTFPTLAGAWGTGLIFLLAGLILLLFFRNVASATILDQYFRALTRQDYATAFQYLDLSMQPGQSDPDTQAWFTRRAQAADESGTIINYALRGFQLNPGRTMYTIKVSRANRSYLVHLSLSKRGDTWKIAGFDLL